MAEQSADNERLIEHLNGSLDALAKDAAESAGDDAGPPPPGLADRTMIRLHAEGLLPAAAAVRRRTFWRHPITNTAARLATAAGLVLAMGILFIPETADRVVSVQDKILGQRLTDTLSRWGDVILDRWI